MRVWHENEGVTTISVSVNSKRSLTKYSFTLWQILFLPERLSVKVLSLISGQCLDVSNGIVFVWP